MGYTLKNKFAIGCLVQWYEVEMVDEYFETILHSIGHLENKENVNVDIMFNMSQVLEKVDTKQISLEDIKSKFYNQIEKLRSYDISVSYFFWEENRPYTIADYRREFNERWCTQVDVLMWGESDALLPKQTFISLDVLHETNKENKTYKYLTFFGTCKMWDETWKALEHPDFTDYPSGGVHAREWYGTRYVMNIDEMNKINDKVEDLKVNALQSFKFNGCGLVISSDVIKAGANIPKAVFFTHEDTAFMNQMNMLFQGSVPQFVINNLLLVHNREHPKKRMYVLDESGESIGEQRKSNDWYEKAAKYSEHNAYNYHKQVELYKWEDILGEIEKGDWWENVKS